LYLNRGIQSIFFALKPNSSPTLAVDQLAYVLEREEAKTLIKIDFDKDKIVHALKNSESIQDRVSCVTVMNLFYAFLLVNDVL
jgi:hypothetical protein